MMNNPLGEGKKKTKKGRKRIEIAKCIVVFEASSTVNNPSYVLITPPPPTKRGTGAKRGT